MDGMKSFTRNSRRALPLIVAACAAALPYAATAADKKWDGGTANGNQWDTVSNWSNNPAATDGSAGSAPVSTDDVIFDNSLRNPIAPVIGLGGSNAMANSITFGSTVGTALGAFSLQAQTSGTTGRTLTITSGNVTVNSAVTGTQTLGNASNGTLTLDTASDFTFTNNSATQALTVTAGFTAGKSLTMATSGGAITLDAQRSAPTFAWLASAASNTLITNGAASGTQIVTLNGTGTHAFAGAINDGATAKISLTLNNAALVQTLSGNSNYSGATIVTAGQLNINSTTAIGNSTITLGGTIDNTTANDITLTTNNAINLINSNVTFGGTKNLSFGTGAVTWSQNAQTINLNGTGRTITFGGLVTNTPSGSTGQTMTVNGVGNTLVLGGMTSAARTGGKTFNFGGTANVTITGPISDGLATLGVSVALAGSGTLLLQGSNSYTGTTSASIGTVQALKPGSLPGYDTTGKVSVASNAGSTLALNVGGAGEWASGDIDLLRSKASFVSSVSALGFDTTNASAVTGFTYASDITNSISLTKLGANALILTGANTFGGAVVIKAGTLQVGNGGASGTLGVSTQAVTNTGTLAINRSDNLSLARPISGSGNLVQMGGGTTTLTGANTFTGSTAVTAGILKLDSGGSLANSNINLAGGTLAAGTNTGGGTITYRVTGDTADLITLSTGGVLDLTNLKLNLQLTGTQTQSEYVIADKAVGSGFVAGSQFLSVINLGTAVIDYDGTAANPNSIVLTSVPEPGCVSLLGLAAMGFLKRRRRVVG